MCVYLQLTEYRPHLREGSQMTTLIPYAPECQNFPETKEKPGHVPLDSKT